MKARYWILTGAILGWTVTFGLYAYGDKVIDSVLDEFRAAVSANATTIVYKAQESQSKIAVMWAEEEQMPWKEAITVRVGTPKDNNVRTIIFQKQ